MTNFGFAEPPPIPHFATGLGKAAALRLASDPAISWVCLFLRVPGFKGKLKRKTTKKGSLQREWFRPGISPGTTYAQEVWTWQNTQPRFAPRKQESLRSFLSKSPKSTASPAGGFEWTSRVATSPPGAWTLP